jgi:hypothetical protein
MGWDCSLVNTCYIYCALRIINWAIYLFLFCPYRRLSPSEIVQLLPTMQLHILRSFLPGVSENSPEKPINDVKVFDQALVGTPLEVGKRTMTRDLGRGRVSPARQRPATTLQPHSNSIPMPTTL